MHTQILLVFIIHFIYASYAIQCGQSPCPSGNACCIDYATGYRCYDPKTYHCIANDMNQTVLCASKQKACGTACYNPAMFSCTTGEVLCGTTTSGQKIKSCAGQCYNPTNYKCCKGKLVDKSVTTQCSPVSMPNNSILFCSPYSQQECTPGLSCCGGSCYDASSHTCFENKVCPLGNKACGGVCYDTQTQECCNDQVFAAGASVCSKASARCCSCSCKSTLVSGTSGTFTVPAGQCTSSYVKNHFGNKLDCPASTFKSCASNSSCRNTINCGSTRLFFERCSGYNDSCSGTYLCGGGDYTCNVKSQSACPVPVSDQYESGHNVTLVTPGTTSYEYVPPAFAGKVCCWCTANVPVASSSIVPSYNDCNPTYVAANNYFDYANATCRVWSRDLYDSQGLACGLPSL